MNEVETILKALNDHKERTVDFHEQVNLKLNETTYELKRIGQRLDISNGRMAKQEEITQRLREEDIGMRKELSFIKENSGYIRDRTWAIITGVAIALIVSGLSWIIIKIK